MKLAHRIAAAVARPKGWINRVLLRLGVRGGLQVTARITYPIGRATIAIGDGPEDFAPMRARPVAGPACVSRSPTSALRK